MPKELDALLEAIRESPQDDLPRLALSDWCMEQSDPAVQARGEMIQLRARAAELPIHDPQRGRMEQRVGELRQQYETAWLGGLARPSDSVQLGWDFERGMILVEVTAQSLRAGILERLAAQPDWIWVIGLKGVLLSAADVRRLMLVGRVRADIGLGPPLLANLTSLDLCDCDLGEGGVRALTRSRLEYLASLKLGYTRCADEGAVALAEAANLRRLTVLALFNNSIGPAGASAIASAKHLSRLTLLDLSRNPLGDAGARALAHSPNLAGLTHLMLCSCGIGDRGGVAFIDSTQRDLLQHLDLRDNRFRNATRKELSARYGTRVLLSER